MPPLETSIPVALYVLDDEGCPQPARSYDEWITAQDQRDRRRIALTELPDGQVVSTIFVGIDLGSGGYPPLLFETAIRRPPVQSWLPLARWGTRREALLGHRRIVAEPTWVGGDHGE